MAENEQQDYLDDNLGELMDHPFGDPKSTSCPKSVKLLSWGLELFWVLAIIILSVVPLQVFILLEKEGSFLRDFGVIAIFFVFDLILCFIRVKITSGKDFVGIYAWNVYGAPTIVGAVLAIGSIVLYFSNAPAKLDGTFFNCANYWTFTMVKLVEDLMFHIATNKYNCPHCGGWRMRYYLGRSDGQTHYHTDTKYVKEKVGEEHVYHGDGTVERYGIYDEVPQSVLKEDKDWSEHYVCLRCGHTWKEDFHSSEEVK